MEWISIKDRFPEHHQKVIFFVKDREECFCGFFEKYCDRRSGRNENVFYENLDGWRFEDEEITHWMPLPQPPKE